MMTKNPNLGFSFLGEGGRGGGRARQGEVLVGRVELLFSYVTHCINLIHIALYFHQDIP